MPTKVTAAETRAASAWLRRRKLGTKIVSPRLFAMASKELDKPFRETLQELASDGPTLRDDTED